MAIEYGGMVLSNQCNIGIPEMSSLLRSSMHHAIFYTTVEITFGSSTFASISNGTNLSYSPDQAHTWGVLRGVE